MAATISWKYLFHLLSVCEIECLGEINKQERHLEFVLFLFFFARTPSMIRLIARIYVVDSFLRKLF